MRSLLHQKKPHAFAAAITIFICFASLAGDIATSDTAKPNDSFHQPTTTSRPVVSTDLSKSFWSFQPIQNPALPKVKSPAWVANPIDQFILAELEKHQLQPAIPANREILIRRLTFDLTGLPPTPDEIRIFLADKSVEAYEKLVDRLLNSPHYGEKWGRHWLDVARYVQGRITFPGVPRTAGDQHYRDYIVRAFNTDKPYDRFITEQLAGDLLEPDADKQAYFDQITAPAFLSIGSWFDMETDPNRLRLEMIDEMINTSTKAFLGLSVACARCHDHPFDPIPTADYYKLGGIFKSTRLVGDFSDYWRDGRVRQLRPLAIPSEVAANQLILDQITNKQNERWNLLSTHHTRLSVDWKAQENQYRTAIEIIPKPWVKSIEAENFSGQSGLRIAQLMRNGKAVEVIESLLPKTQMLKYTVEVPQTGDYQLDALLSTGDRTALMLTVNGKVISKATLDQPTGGADLKYQRWTSAGKFELREGLNFIRFDAKEGNFPRLDRFLLYRLDDAIEQAIAAVATADKLNPLLLANYVYNSEDPLPEIAGTEPYLSRMDQQKLQAIAADVENLTSQLAPYEQIIAVTDQQKPVDMEIHPRGSIYTMRDPVSRGVLSTLNSALPAPIIAANHSGRLELAQWLTDPRNPLTARVMVNRIWHWHFGRGLVSTTSDFGTRGSLPSHPELLEYLADQFRKPVAEGGCGWSIKKLNTLILTSNTYRQSSRVADDQSESISRIDPGNVFLSHFPRRRLESEELFDSLFSVRNIMARQLAGQALDVDKSKGRAMYVLTSGRSPEGLGMEVRKMFALFDYDSSGVPIAERPVSQTPAQALFWMNSPLVKYYADKLAERLLKMDQLDDAKRINMAYLISIGHPPSKELAAASLNYLEQLQKTQSLAPAAAWAKLCQAIFASDEFRWVD